MKLVRYGAAGREKPGMIDDKGQIRDLSKVIPDLAGEALGAHAGREAMTRPAPQFTDGKFRAVACVRQVAHHGCSAWRQKYADRDQARGVAQLDHRGLAAAIVDP